MNQLATTSFNRARKGARSTLDLKPCRATNLNRRIKKSVPKSSLRTLCMSLDSKALLLAWACVVVIIADGNRYDTTDGSEAKQRRA